MGPIYSFLIWWQRCLLIPQVLYMLLLLFVGKFSLFFPIKCSFQELCLFGTKLKGEDVVKGRDHFTVPINTASHSLLLLKSNWFSLWSLSSKGNLQTIRIHRYHFLFNIYHGKMVENLYNIFFLGFGKMILAISYLILLFFYGIRRIL